MNLDFHRVCLVVLFLVTFFLGWAAAQFKLNDVSKLPGTLPGGSSQLDSALTVDSLNSEIEKNYAAYLYGDLDEARKRMMSIVSILDQSFNTPSHFILKSRFNAHARLFYIERFAGEHSAATIHFAQARYWYFREKFDSGMTKADVAELVTEFNEAKCEDYVRQWDASRTAGRGAAWAATKNGGRDTENGGHEEPKRGHY